MTPNFPTMQFTALSSRVELSVKVSKEDWLRIPEQSRFHFLKRCVITLVEVLNNASKDTKNDTV